MVAFRNQFLHEQLLRSCVRDVFSSRLQVRLGAGHHQLAFGARGLARRVVSRRALAPRCNRKPDRLHSQALYIGNVFDPCDSRASDAAFG